MECPNCGQERPEPTVVGTDVQLVNIPRDQAKLILDATAPGGRFGGNLAHDVNAFGFESPQVSQRAGRDGFGYCAHAKTGTYSRIPCESGTSLSGLGVWRRPYLYVYCTPKTPR